MFHQTIALNQRTKGIKVKVAFQFTLLLGVCIWLLYQMKHSNDNRKDYDAALQNNHKEHRSIRLGGKGNGWSTHGAEMEEDETDIKKGRKELDGGGGDDELDRDMEEDTIHKDYEALKDLSNPEVKDKGRVSGTHQKERKRDETGSLGNYEKAYNKIKELSLTNEDAHMENEKEFNILEATKEFNMQETTIVPAETKMSTVMTVDKGNEIDGFQDENGIPEDGHELLNSLISKTNGDAQP